MNRPLLSFAAALCLTSAFNYMAQAQVTHQQIAQSHAATTKTTARIQAALNRECELNIAESPLCEVQELIQKTHGIPVQIDNLSLEELGLSTDSPVICKVSGVTLRAGLNLCLNELGLAWTIRNEVLLITSMESMKSVQRCECYSIKELITQGATKEEVLTIINSTLGCTKDKPQSTSKLASAKLNARASDASPSVLPIGDSVFVKANERQHEQMLALLGKLHQTLNPAQVATSKRPVPPQVSPKTEKADLFGPSGGNQAKSDPFGASKKKGHSPKKDPFGGGGTAASKDPFGE